MLDSTRRFSSRVSDYVKYRPRYPRAVLAALKERGLKTSHVFADIGSGTGILSGLFLRNGNTVIGIEPNEEMRQAGEKLLSRFAKFQSVAARAEATGLDAASVDWVTAGQAFHWFDAAKAKAEFRRILRPGGRAALVWNERRDDTTEFLREYEKLLCAFGTDYAEVQHRDGSQDMRLEKFFARMEQISFENFQHFDFRGLKGRLLSSSYAPQKGHRNHVPMLKELRRIFSAHQRRGKIRFEYDTRLYVGSL